MSRWAQFIAFLTYYPMAAWYWVKDWWPYQSYYKLPYPPPDPIDREKRRAEHDALHAPKAPITPVPADEVKREPIDFAKATIPSNLKRITPTEIVAAYKKTGLIPISHSFWWKMEGDKLGGCGLTAIACDKLNKKGDEYYMRGALVAESLQPLGYDWAYLQGFTCGFDSKPLNMLESFITAVGTQTVEHRETIIGKAYAGFLDGTESYKAVGSPKAAYHHGNVFAQFAQK